MANDYIRLASPLQFDSIVDGPGCRTILWTQGCKHHCLGCHNPQTHDLYAGKLYLVEDIIQQIEEARLQTGLTLSGGEPFLQVEPLLLITAAAKSKHMNIWAYSGFLFEELIKDPIKKLLLEQVDVLVDGKFRQQEKDYRLSFKGSKNQRIIDVQASLREHKIIRSSYDENNLMLD